MESIYTEESIVGTEFLDFDQFERYLEIYEKMNMCKFYKADSRTIERANKAVVSSNYPLYPKKHKYSYIRYKCKHGGTHRSRSSGKRPNTRTYRIGCPCHLLLKSDRQAQKLLITACTLQHNHPISSHIFQMYSQSKKNKTNELVKHVSAPLVTVELEQDIDSDNIVNLCSLETTPLNSISLQGNSFLNVNEQHDNNVMSKWPNLNLDDDELFCLSLVDSFKNIPLDKKYSAKMDIYNIIESYGKDQT